MGGPQMIADPFTMATLYVGAYAAGLVLAPFILGALFALSLCWGEL